MELLSLGIKSVFIDNIIFAYFLGMCSFLAVSKKVSTAVGLGAAVIFVLGITVPLNWVIQEHVLKLGALSWISPSFAEIDLEFLFLQPIKHGFCCFLAGYDLRHWEWVVLRHRRIDKSGIDQRDCYALGRQFCVQYFCQIDQRGFGRAVGDGAG